MADGSPHITADSALGDILDRYPEAGPILLQHGRMFRAEKGRLYAEYGRMSVAEYATANRIDVERLTRALSAAAESSARHRPSGDRPPSDAFRRGAALGYTGAYRELHDLDIQSVVTAQTSKGPE